MNHRDIRPLLFVASIMLDGNTLSQKGSFSRVFTTFVVFNTKDDRLLDDVLKALQEYCKTTANSCDSAKITRRGIHELVLKTVSHSVFTT